MTSKAEQKQATDNSRVEAMPKAYTLKEIGEAVGVTYRTLLTYIKTGKLKAVKIGGSWRVSEEKYNDFLNGR